MSKILKTINDCKKEKLSPNIALAAVALLFYGNDSTEKEILGYCDRWCSENGDINYPNLRRFAKNLGYEGEIVEIWMENCLEKN